MYLSWHNLDSKRLPDRIELDSGVSSTRILKQAGKYYLAAPPVVSESSVRESAIEAPQAGGIPR